MTYVRPLRVFVRNHALASAFISLPMTSAHDGESAAAVQKVDPLHGVQVVDDHLAQQHIMQTQTPEKANGLQPCEL